MYSINIPVDSFCGYFVDGVYLFRKEKIDSKDWVPGMPTFIDIPMSCPVISSVEYKEDSVILHFLLETQEEKTAWPHTKKFLNELFGIKCQQVNYFPEEQSYEELVIEGIGLVLNLLDSYHTGINREISKYFTPEDRRLARNKRMETIRKFQLACLRSLIRYERIVEANNVSEETLRQIYPLLETLRDGLTMY